MIRKSPNTHFLRAGTPGPWPLADGKPLRGVMVLDGLSCPADRRSARSDYRPAMPPIPYPSRGGQGSAGSAGSERPGTAHPVVWHRGRGSAPSFNMNRHPIQCRWGFDQPEAGRTEPPESITGFPSSPSSPSSSPPDECSHSQSSRGHAL
jgi:hypothetical protein